MNAERLVANYERIADAPDAINRLRQFILNLAVRGKLVPQDPNDEPALQLVRQSFKERDRIAGSGKTNKSNSKILGMAYVPYDLPASWQWVMLGEFFSYDAGVKRSPETLNPSFWLLDLEDIEKDTGRVHTRANVSDRKPSSTKSEFKVDDILYGKLRPYLNKVVVATEPGYSTTEIVAIRPFIPICSKYCAMALRRQDFVAYVERSGQGTKMPRLRKYDAIAAPFPLPPLAEQHRIVNKVDELMVLCDKLEAARLKRESALNQFTRASLSHLNEPNPATFQDDVRFVINNFSSLTASIDQINKIRQTILNLAVRGKLVSQDPNDEPAMNLVEDSFKEKERLMSTDKANKSNSKILGMAYVPYDLPASWQWVMLGEFFSYDAGVKRSPETLNPSFWLLDLEDIEKDTGRVHTRANVSDRKPSSTKSEFKVDDILYGKLRPYLNKVVVATEPGYSTTEIVAIRPFIPICSKYCAMALRRQDFVAYVERSGQGTKMPRLRKYDAIAAPFPLPPLAEQHRIVNKVDELMTLCDRLETHLSKKDVIQNHLLDALVHEVLTHDASMKQAA